jgi:type II secretory pathway component PulF
MPNYRYTAISLSGRREEGERVAASPQALADHLDREGLSIETCDLLDPVQPVSPFDQVGEGEARALVGQIAGLTASGLTLPEGLGAIAEELPNGRLRRLVEELQVRVAAGESADAALGALRSRFPSHVIEVLQAGLRSGKAGEVLGAFTAASERVSRTRNRVWLSMAYPLVLLFVFFVVFVLACFLVIQGFASIFADFGIDVPLITRWLLNLSEAVTRRPLSTILGPPLALVIIWAASRLLLDRASRRRIMNRLPLFGPLFRLSSMAQFSNDLAMLVDVGVALPRGVELASRASGDPALAADCVALADQVRAGASLAHAIESTGALPIGFAALLRWAEGGAGLAGTLRAVAGVLEAQVRARGTFVAAAVTIFVIVVVIWSVMIAVIALFLPLIQLITRLSG